MSLARGFVRDAAPGLDEDQGDLLVLLTSELVTNAILHTRSPVEVGVALSSEEVLVVVADRVPSRDGLKPRRYSDDRPGGRGLALVADLSKDWGTSSYTGGKSVWFTLPTEHASLKAG